MKPRSFVLGIISTILVFAASVAAQSDRDLGIQAYRNNDYQKAAAFLEKHLATNKKDTTAWKYLGGAYSYLGDGNKARKAFSKSFGNSGKDFPILTYDTEFRIIAAPKPRLSEETRNRSRGANVRVLIELRDDGRVGFVYPFPNFEASFEHDAVYAAKGIQFTPATKDGKPVTVIITREYSFWTN
jgi:tetratricopeptide (TPR) repeat protein